MRRYFPVILCFAGLMALGSCEDPNATDREPLGDLDVIDEANLSHLMLTAADPSEAVNYFKRAASANPDRVDLLRGLAQSLVRAGSTREAATVWEKVVAHPNSEPSDQVSWADSLIRLGEWDEAESVLDDIPPTHESFKRYRLEAMVADSNQEWSNADSFYETAVGLTTQPAGVLNNWGFSKLTRGDFREAETLFGESLQYDSTLFTAKNNLVLARAAQRNYDLPVVPMSQVERAQLLYTAALAAIKQGDILTGKSLLKQAIDTHPQHFDAAVRSLRALEENVVN